MEAPYPGRQLLERAMLLSAIPPPAIPKSPLSRSPVRVHPLGLVACHLGINALVGYDKAVSGI